MLNNPFQKAAVPKTAAKSDVSEELTYDIGKSTEEVDPQILVVATMDGWYDQRRIMEGDKFLIPSKLVSKRWMEIVK